MVKTGLLDKKYPAVVHNFYFLSRGILHNQINQISGEHYDQYFKEAKEFIDLIKVFVEK
ncbi:MAG: hypothetical protein V1743_01010 [Nanoarchaeota archaeon]